MFLVGAGPDRSFCHTYGRGKDEYRMIPGWPSSFITALEPGRTFWTALLDAVRLPPAADLTTLTCTQIRQLVGRLTAARQCPRPLGPAPAGVRWWRGG